MSLFKDLFGKKNKIEKVDLTKRFDLIGRIGQGSMSEVWRARDTFSGRTVAVKVLDLVKTMRHEQRFVGLNKPTEGEIAVLLDHEHIVQTSEHGITIKDEQFLVMEFLEGVGLSFLVDVQNDLMKTNRLRFAIELGSALEYLHQNDIIHRDICPRNVVVTQEEASIKLIDFGLAVPNTPDFQKPGNRTGTANYMAPELVKRQRTDHQIDIYSFGVTCYEMYTRMLPWGDASNVDTLEAVMHRINTPPEDIRTHDAEIDDQIADAIMKAVTNSPQARWYSLADMLYEFKDARSRLEGIPFDDEFEDADEYVEVDDDSDGFLPGGNSPVPDNPSRQHEAVIFQEVDDEFEEVDDDFEEVDDEFEEVDDDFEEVGEEIPDPSATQNPSHVGQNTPKKDDFDSFFEGVVEEEQERERKRRAKKKAVQKRRSGRQRTPTDKRKAQPKQKRPDSSTD